MSCLIISSYISIIYADTLEEMKIEIDRMRCDAEIRRCRVSNEFRQSRHVIDSRPTQAKINYSIVYSHPSMDIFIEID